MAYPQDQLIALRRQNAEAQAAQPVASGVDLANVNFRYAIEGDRAPWRPLRAFDDGRQVFIEFPRGIGQGEMPPLFVVGPEGNTSELVNYRVRGHHMIVDRLFAAAELRFGPAASRSASGSSAQTGGRPREREPASDEKCRTTMQPPDRGRSGLRRCGCGPNRPASPGCRGRFSPASVLSPASGSEVR
jgi:hypothetical protein